MCPWDTGGNFDKVRVLGPYDPDTTLTVGPFKRSPSKNVTEVLIVDVKNLGILREIVYK